MRGSESSHHRGPGTGKTVLAIEAARRFAEQGLRTLLLCFNAPLGGFLTQATTSIEGLVAMHFHGLCRAWAQEADLEKQLAAAENAEGYLSVFPELLLTASERLARTFDAIVADEAQDFRTMRWAAVEGILSEESAARLYLFEDQQQVLYDDIEVERPAGLVGPLRLTKDCRNSDEIHAFLAACPGGHPDLRPSGISTGFRPRITWIEDSGKLPRRVSAIVADLMANHGLPASEIVVLTPRSQPRSGLGRTERLGPAPVSWRDRDSDQHVLVDTLHRFKGIESTAVVFAEVGTDVWPDLPTCLRVGCSRAKLHLDLLAEAELAPRLTAAVKHAVVV